MFQHLYEYAVYRNSANEQSNSPKNFEKALTIIVRCEQRFNGLSAHHIYPKKNELTWKGFEKWTLLLIFYFTFLPVQWSRNDNNNNNGKSYFLF